MTQLFALVRKLRKRWIDGRIALAIHDQNFYKRQIDAAIEEICKAEEREYLWRQRRTEVDHPLPRLLRTRIGT